MFPPPQPQQPRSRGPLLFGVAAAAAVVIAAVVLVVSGVFSGDEEPTAIATDTSEESEPEPTTQPEESPTEEEPASGGAYTPVEDICAIMEPIVAGYMTIDAAETEVSQLGSAVTCSMAGEFVDTFDRPWIDVKQDIEPDKADLGLEEYGYHEGIRSGCAIEEDPLPDFEESAYFHGDASSGCVILGHSYGLHAADGNMFLSASVYFSSESSSLGGEEQLLIDLIEAVAAAS
ncbi:hypothetical protein [Glycomyces sp. NRRL B-16210]|uniref:hypothetical protein n=1 Tax=Glycomyces sp. NRRL B-16210 TaxID=1463821 RepID=UPI0004BFC07D|nr:hypothetical protein [Glycomyces sp. NRRL B-16210]